MSSDHSTGYSKDAHSVLRAVRGIHKCRQETEFAKTILGVLREIFEFDYLLYCVNVKRNGERWYRGKHYDGDASPNIVTDTARREHPETPDQEDILWYIHRLGEIKRVDPEDQSDPLSKRLHQETVKKHQHSNPIYFIPLKHANEVYAIIHASIPRERDPQLTSSTSDNARFLTHLYTLADSAGIVIEGMERQLEFQREKEQRDIILKVGTKLNEIQGRKNKFFLMLTAITCNQGLRFNRAMLFLSDLAGNFSGVFGIMPKDQKHFLSVNKELSQWQLEDYQEAYQKHHDQYIWPTNVLSELTLEMNEDSPVSRCYQTLQVMECNGEKPMDAAFEKRKFQKIHIPKVPYVIVPVKSANKCLGFLYLDNAYTGAKITSIRLLEILGDQLGAMILENRKQEHHEQVRNALSEFMQEVSQILKNDDYSEEHLYGTLITFMLKLGANKACIATKETPNSDWKISKGSEGWDREIKNLSKYLNKKEKAQGKSPLGQVHTLDENPGKLKPKLVISTLAFTSKREEISLCMEYPISLEIDPRLLEAVGVFSALTSAILSSIEVLEFNDVLAETFSDDHYIFAEALLLNVAHETKNVLNDLAWAVDGFEMNNKRLSHSDRHQINLLTKRIEAAAEAMTANIDILDESKNTRSDETAWTLIEPAAKQVLRLLAPRILRQGKNPQDMVSIKCENHMISLALPQLSLILSNLISNAIKAVQNTSSPEITITSELTSKGLVNLKVTDNGSGITNDERDKIFNAGYSGFRRQEEKRHAHFGDLKNKINSTGVGLFGIKNLVELEPYGSLQINSGSGKTEAIVTLRGKQSK